MLQAAPRDANRAPDPDDRNLAFRNELVQRGTRDAQETCSVADSEEDWGQWVNACGRGTRCRSGEIDARERMAGVWTTDHGVHHLHLAGVCFGIDRGTADVAAGLIVRTELDDVPGPTQ